MSDYSDYQALRNEVDALKRSVQVLEHGERFENLEKLIEANTAAIQTIASSTQHLLSEQNRKIEALETNLRGDLDKLETNLRGDMSELRGNINADMTKLETSLRGDMSELRGDINTDMTKLETSLRGNTDKLETNLRSDMSTLRDDMNKLNNKFETVRNDLESKINHSQTVVIGTIGAVGVVLAAIQFLIARGG